MSSSDETHFSEEEDRRSSKRISFVNALKGNAVVLNRSLSAKTVTAKEKAWANICTKYEQSVGKKVTLVQLKKMLNNMKNETKKKDDKRKTGNKQVKLQAWEKDFLAILEEYERPVIMKMPGAVSIGAEGKISSSPNETYDWDSSTTVLINGKQCLPTSNSESEKTPKAAEDAKRLLRKKTKDTDETCKLSTAELQRLVLNEQLRLIRFQMKREEMKMRREEMKLRLEQLRANTLNVGLNSDADGDLTQFDISYIE